MRIATRFDPQVSFRQYEMQRSHKVFAFQAEKLDRRSA